jgi:hypothetical protein
MMAALTATRLMRIRRIDPGGSCEAGETMLELFRMRNAAEGDDATHLVFLDRRGWYCAHGRDCPAAHAAGETCSALVAPGQAADPGSIE